LNELILAKNELKVKWFYVWIHSCKSEPNNKFESTNQFYNQKLQILA
jgi:hypothetical protein